MRELIKSPNAIKVLDHIENSANSPRKKEAFLARVVQKSLNGESLEKLFNHQRERSLTDREGQKIAKLSTPVKIKSKFSKDQMSSMMLFHVKPINPHLLQRDNSRIMLAKVQYNERKQVFETINVVDANDIAKTPSQKKDTPLYSSRRIPLI